MIVAWAARVPQRNLIHSEREAITHRWVVYLLTAPQQAEFQARRTGLEPATTGSTELGRRAASVHLAETPCVCRGGCLALPVWCGSGLALVRFGAHIAQNGLLRPDCGRSAPVACMPEHQSNVPTGGSDRLRCVARFRSICPSDRRHSSSGNHVRSDIHASTQRLIDGLSSRCTSNQRALAVDTQTRGSHEERGESVITF